MDFLFKSIISYCDKHFCLPTKYNIYNTCTGCVCVPKHFQHIVFYTAAPTLCTFIISNTHTQTHSTIFTSPGPCQQSAAARWGGGGESNRRRVVGGDCGRRGYGVVLEKGGCEATNQALLLAGTGWWLAVWLVGSGNAVWWRMGVGCQYFSASLFLEREKTECH